MNDEEIVAALAEVVATALDAAYHSSSYRWPQQEDCPRIAAAILPVVRRVAEQRAAEGARAAAMSLRAEGEFRAADRCDAITAVLTTYGCKYHSTRCETPNALCLVDCTRAAALTATPEHGTDATT